MSGNFKSENNMSFEEMLRTGNFSPPHKLHDSIFTIADYSYSRLISCFELAVYECKDAISSISISDSGFEYYSEGMAEPFAYGDRFDDEGDFWTREEAVEYLKSLEPMINTFHQGDLVYFLNDSGSRIKEAEVSAVTFYNGKVSFETDEGFTFAYDELGEKYFKTKEELKEKIDKIPQAER